MNEKPKQKTPKKKSKKQNAKEMPFLDHLEELRIRLFWILGSIGISFIIILPLTKYILPFLTYPNERLKEPAELIFLKPTGMLMVRIEIALVAGLILSMPLIIYHLWKFISPGLFPNERKYIFPIIFFTSGCFILGGLFAYFIMLSVVLPFLFGMGTEAIAPTININDYIGFILRLIVLCGLIFELPILSFFLARVGILTPMFMKKYRRYGIVLVFVLAALITPPDPLSQLLIAFPLIVLYEISIIVCRFGYKKKKEHDIACEEEMKSKNQMSSKDISDD